ncbi:threonylcarbamoyl-AMP synthase [Pontibacter sp. BT310]|jgi:tRNA threonylcarbamoyl adenosine modification protein (Sua5/YciO/YrdC/YwlC family)|uniref:Threonylcarbamoyl-AMP synthase n=1 Tax=Pontibacter populi TaxID=890055 RepID=A0ABS6X6S4_9BACT|nr:MULTISPECIES: L-threonylcarbamoyladenylate synthase [Pontibacter]MBJ6116844.1 threonylcarbamoyl-AMP synthase [Pontibacter sp. BT310]MBR0569266.1 threonylcarbamoyl-AMP synthase [Microvirga sp. STS03]MBW3363697.1 threonylcarbamoyl-AMP synthase [Pontibacter populi]
MSNAIFLQIHPDNPQDKKIREAVEVLRNGGVIIYPTDTIYGMGCDIHNARAIERVCQIKGVKPDKVNLSFICSDLTHISDYAKIDTPTYKVMKKALPGPFTFILDATSHVPKYAAAKKKTVGIRVPDNNIALALVRELGNPIVSTSIRDEDEVLEYSTDPELIYEKYRNLVDMVIDGGPGNNIASTVVDAANDFEVLRQGAGDIEEFL